MTLQQEGSVPKRAGSDGPPDAPSRAPVWRGRQAVRQGAVGPMQARQLACAHGGRLSDWKIDRNGWLAVEGGLRRVYRAGRRALSLAAGHPSVENLHEWRKQSKYLWHQLQLLEPAWAVSEKALGDQFHTLSQILGEDHDLAVLRQTLAADPLSYGGHRTLKLLFALVDRQRGELERQAFALGRQLYGGPPKLFTSRIEAYWKAWTGESEGANSRSVEAPGKPGGRGLKERIGVAGSKATSALP